MVSYLETQISMQNFFDLALNRVFQDIAFQKKLNEPIRGDLKTTYQSEFTLYQINEAVEFPFA